MNGAAGETAPSKHAAGPAGPGPAGSTGPSGPPSSATSAGPRRPTGQMPNFVSVAKAYMFQQEIDQCLTITGVSPAREDNLRLAGVQWIENVRRTLKLPVRTFDTAVVYYHKFRLQHSDSEYKLVDAAAAALFSACKIEDTLKKSRDILCAAHNMNANRHDQLSPDDQIFEPQSRIILGLERLMLEASGFDFRNRHPQPFLIKLAKFYNYSKASLVVKTAYAISLDLYRTFAPLKQQTATLAFACLELAGRLRKEENEVIWQGRDYADWQVERGMVMETMLDLLELYTHHRNQTAIGPDFSVDAFLETRITLNKECQEKNLPRFTAWVDETHLDQSNPNYLAGSGPGVGHHLRVNGSSSNGQHPRGGGAGRTISPRDATGKEGGSSNNIARTKVGERGKEGTIRFILNPDREMEERRIVETYTRA
ncbi:hypothetical protein PV10_00936 [Exophiala mesophila]|uniref:RNA polymerase II holoenzyme cyclin-like subunit n=1 Tax=Exophiala mesophila TaxID=212818 RepID=A0A0D1ZTA6_EXOME|nr:uncharacterized protein PV10_00936 [Exophiala mesophila]KIV97154.1 hypothetical protein PV10_00936 [Exophiala mesophila]